MANQIARQLWEPFAEFLTILAFFTSLYVGLQLAGPDPHHPVMEPYTQKGEE